MLLGISKKIADSLVQNDVVKSEEVELYEYGVRQGIVLVINIMTAVLIGLILGMVLQSIVFLLAYMPIRSYAGGYHAGSQLTCYLFSIPFMLAALIGIKMVPWNIFLCIAALACAGLIIAIFAPVEDSNKPLDQVEQTVYKRKTYFILAVLISAAILFWMISLTQISLSIIMAIVMAAVMLILGVLKNKIKKRA